MSIERKAIMISLITVKNVVKGLKINEQSFAFTDGMESLGFDVDEILRTQPNGIEWFSDRLTNDLTNDVVPISLKEQLLKVMIDIGENCSFSKCAIADALDISRELNNKIMRIASSCGVIGPRGMQFRLRPGVVSQLKKQLNLLNREEGIESETKIKPPDFTAMRKQAYQDIHEGEGGSIEESVKIGVKEVKIPRGGIVRAVIRSQENIKKEIDQWNERLNNPQYVEEKHNIVDEINKLKRELRQGSPLGNIPQRQILPRKKPALLLAPVPGKKPQKLLKA